jgi:hypothetical protein
MGWPSTCEPTEQYSRGIASCLRILGVAYVVAAASDAPDLAQSMIAAALASLTWELRSGEGSHAKRRPGGLS